MIPGSARTRGSTRSASAASVRLRRRLVGNLEDASAIRSGAVREAFLAVPRELFIPEVASERGIAAVYEDEAYPTKADARGDAISSSSQPQIMAVMLEALGLAPGHRVLEIGTGTGYNAALLSHVVGASGRVTSVELDPDLVPRAKTAVAAAGRRAAIVTGDGTAGFDADAPYDRIVVTASSLEVPRALRDELVDGGVLVMPLRLTDALPFQQVVVAFERAGTVLCSRSVACGGFMRMRSRPEDPSLPWPEIRAVDRTGGRERTLASLSGDTLNAFSEDERARLLALMLTKPSRRPLGMRLSEWARWELQSFVAIAGPERRLIGCIREDLRSPAFTALPGIVRPDSRGLAHLSGGRTISRLDVYGRLGPERELSALVLEWRRRGRVGVAELRIEVTFDEGGRRAWRTKRRAESTILFDWG